MSAPRAALAYVAWKFLTKTRRDPGEFFWSYWYCTDQSRILDLVGEGGELWAVTGVKHRKRLSHFSLAYRLEDCRPVDLSGQPAVRETFGAYGVQGDKLRSELFRANDVTDVLLDLTFEPPRPIGGRADGDRPGPATIASSLQTLRELAPADRELLQAHAQNVRYGRHTFLSYARRDRDLALRLERALKAAGQTVFRDEDSLALGRRWEPGLHEAIARAEVFVVVLTRAAARSEWVRWEVEGAVAAEQRRSGIEHVVPVVVDTDALSAFPRLRPFQAHALPRRQWNERNLEALVRRLVPTPVGAP